MHASIDGESSRRCLIPFQAHARAVGELRHAVARQLAAWGLGHLTDSAALVVSELATNVVQHVGSGSPAALVVEVVDGVVRLELHDTGVVVPHRVDAQPEDEAGRGLALVDAMSAGGWDARRTAGGKVIRCELSTKDAGSGKPWDIRVCRASEVLNGYVHSTTRPTAPPAGSMPAVNALTADLITDLLHWLAAHGSDPDTVLDHAQTRFEAETAASRGR